MNEPTTDLPQDAHLPTLLRCVLAGSASTLEPDAAPERKRLGPPQPLPESPDVLKLLIEEAKTFLDALEPVRKNFRLILRLLGSFNCIESIPPQKLRFFQDLQTSNREKVLELGPAIYGIIPYVEWDEESVRNFLAAFGEREGVLADALVPAGLERLKAKVAGVEGFSERIRRLYQQLLNKLEQSRLQISPVLANGTEVPTHPLELPQQGQEDSRASGSQNEAVRSLKNLAVATHDGEEWHLYHRQGNRWRQGRAISLRKGHQTQLMKHFATGAGCLTRSDGVKIWGDLYKVDLVRARKRLKTEVSYLRRALREAMRLGKEPLVICGYDKHAKGWKAEITIGYASLVDSHRTGNEHHWEIKMANALSSEERIDLLS